MSYKNICPVCGAKLDCYDIDFNFNGNQDEYSECMNCHTSFIFYIRYGGLWKYRKTKLYFDEEHKKWLDSDDPHNTEVIYVYGNKKGKDK